jgi:hypothetical protein
MAGIKDGNIEYNLNHTFQHIFSYQPEHDFVADIKLTKFFISYSNECRRLAHVRKSVSRGMFVQALG